MIMFQCAVCLAPLTWEFNEMRGKSPYSFVLEGAASRMCSRQDNFGAVSITFISKCFGKIHVVHPYSSTDPATAWKISHFTFAKKPDFQMFHNLSIAFHT